MQMTRAIKLLKCNALSPHAIWPSLWQTDIYLRRRSQAGAHCRIGWGGFVQFLEETLDAYLPYKFSWVATKSWRHANSQQLSIAAPAASSSYFSSSLAPKIGSILPCILVQQNAFLFLYCTFWLCSLTTSNSTSPPSFWTLVVKNCLIWCTFAPTKMGVNSDKAHMGSLKAKRISWDE